MSNDHGAGYADIIEWSSIKDISPGAAQQFEKVLAKYDNGDLAMRSLFLDGLGTSVDKDAAGDLNSDCEPEECIQLLRAVTKLSDEDTRKAAFEIRTAFRELVGWFAIRTTVRGNSCLRLNIGCLDNEDAVCRGSELEAGHYFFVNGAYGLTAAGKKFKEAFERKIFITQEV